jgi:hypothetical protein
MITAEAKVAVRIMLIVTKDANAFAWGTAANEKSIMVATINTKLFWFLIVAPPALLYVLNLTEKEDPNCQ